MQAAEGPESAAAAGGGEQAADPQAFADAHRELLNDRTLQFRFEELDAPSPPPDWLQALLRFLESIAPILRIVFWIGVAALVALVLFILVREIIRRWPQKQDKAVVPEAAPAMEFRPTQARAKALLEEADRLAAEGRFSEAARVLLHRSIEDIEAAFPIKIGRDLTSREIATLERLSQRTRDVFSQIARAVEISLFGGRDLDASAYQHCRQIYSSFAFDGARA